MKANVENLIKVIELSAKAKRVNMTINDCQIVIQSDSPATICDIQGIVEAFTGSVDAVESGYGYTIVDLEEIEFQDKVNNEEVAMYIPLGWMETEKWY